MTTRNVVLLAVIAACNTSASGPASAPTAQIQTVEVSRVTSQELQATLRLQGELAPYEDVAIFPRVKGFVEEMRVDRGSKVHKGDLLVRLSAPEMIAQRSEAEAQLRAQESTFDRLHAASSTPGAVAKHDLEIAEGELEARKARVQALREHESYLHVKAPFDGVITERNAHPGALVGVPGEGNGTPMLRIEQVQRLRLAVAVPEANVGAVTQGGQAGFVVKAWPDRHFSGTIERISHAVDPRTRTMAVELDVKNDDGALASGMFADVIWPVRRASATLFVPQSSVVQTTERTFIDRVRDDVVEQVVIERGLGMSDRVEVFPSTGGTRAVGDLVMVRGSEELHSGVRVQVKETAARGK